MRIALLSHALPPENTEGIARQRWILAGECARLGHEVHLFAPGLRNALREEAGTRIHTVAMDRCPPPAPGLSAFERLLRTSAALFTALREVHETAPFDVMDTPLWPGLGWVAIERAPWPTVVALQTASAQQAVINQETPSAEVRARIAVEQRCLNRASAILANSHTSLASTRSAYRLPPDTPIGLAYHGLPNLPGGAPSAPASGDETVEGLVVGRLERRKGTPHLLGVLPDLLARDPKLRIRFLGADNSLHDGELRRTGRSYIEGFRTRHPDLASRVIFEGHATEARLAEAYARADFVVVPSLYESFGLVYAEGARAGKPVIAFETGAAREIFPRAEEDGAALAPEGEAGALGERILRLAADPGERIRMGRAGRDRYLAAFTAERSARATLEFYETVRRAPRPRSRPRAARVFQVMDALLPADAVSGIARTHAHTLRAMGHYPKILSRWQAPGQAGEAAPYSVALASPDDCALIFHFWNYNPSAWLLDALRGPAALYTHNITPPEYSTPGSAFARQASDGLRQLHALLDRFDLLIGDSRYNLDSLAAGLSEPRPALVLYPSLDPEAARSAPFRADRLERLRASGAKQILFVGRIARNKAQDRLMRWFAEYRSAFGQPAHLWLVGDDRQDPAYRSELERLRRSLPCGRDIHFTGRVQEEDLTAFYRGADLFACASEHEGFCVPLLHAMAFGIPILALARAAIPETVGPAGFLVRDAADRRMGVWLGLLLNDRGLRDRLTAPQAGQLLRFTPAESASRLEAAVRFLLEGRSDPRFFTLSPKGAS
jgi:glycosyltransferase involved in cell wall biosynthesis